MPILANVIQDAFSPLISLFESIMVFIHAHLVGGSWGLAIVGLTVIIRAVLVPLTFRQLKSMQEMQRLAPQIQALKEKYKDDKQRQQQEIMGFYRENKINPLASCLPLLLQLPVFISLFYMLRTDLKLDICGPQLRSYFTEKLGHPILHNSQIPSGKLSSITCSQVPGAQHSAKFLFLPDITNKATGAALIVLIVLYVGSQLASTLVATATADPNQRRLMLLLPVVFVVILYRYPAGLLVYWITTNMWTIVQQLLIRRHMGAPKQSASGEGPDGGGGGSPNGKPDRPRSPSPKGEPALAGAGVGTGSRPSPPPPRPPRKKKKRSGRRR
jgi:YidC/Oxa1 family membrane protein insertase